MKCTCKGIGNCHCRKVAFRIECYECGYPYSESMYPDSEDILYCTASDAELISYITEYNKQQEINNGSNK